MSSIMRAHIEGILLGGQEAPSPQSLALDDLETVEANIALFLKDKGKTADFRLETAKRNFAAFWNRIRAEGDLEAALSEWGVVYNASSPISRDNLAVHHQV